MQIPTDRQQPRISPSSSIERGTPLASVSERTVIIDDGEVYVCSIPQPTGVIAQYTIEDFQQNSRATGRQTVNEVRLWAGMSRQIDNHSLWDGDPRVGHVAQAFHGKTATGRAKSTRQLSFDPDSSPRELQSYYDSRTTFELSSVAGGLGRATHQERSYWVDEHTRREHFRVQDLHVTHVVMDHALGTVTVLSDQA